MAGERGVEVFAGEARSEVEALAPAVLVEVGDQVVVVVHHGGVLVLARRHLGLVVAEVLRVLLEQLVELLDGVVDLVIGQRIGIGGGGLAGGAAHDTGPQRRHGWC